jgi:hypothetical protein
MSVNEKMTAIADAIRDKTKGTEKLSLDAMAIEIPKVYDAGKIDERDGFWESFQTPTRRMWTNAFACACWNDYTFYPKYDIVPTGNASSLFRYCGITDFEGRLNECGAILDTSGATNLNNAFGESTVTVLPTIDLSKCTTSTAASGVFSGCRSLTTIRKIIIGETIAILNIFNACSALENITFEGVIGRDIQLHYSPLTIESMKSVISHLKNYKGTDNESTYLVKFSDDCWAALEADSTAPNGTTWKEYVTALGWLF